MSAQPEWNHRLSISDLRLVGGGRTVSFRRPFCVVKGSITTGKTTLVLLLRGLLGRVPEYLPPEAGALQAVRGTIDLGAEEWVVTRPITTTPTALVALSRSEETPEGDGRPDLVVETHRLPAESATASEPMTYQNWLLRKLDIPEVSVPRARTDAASEQSPVTINDWLGYCLVRDEEIDTAVFGHKNSWRDRKRRAVFELMYGLYDPTTSALQADLRATELKLEALAHSSLSVEEFLRGTGIGSVSDVDVRISTLVDEIAQLDTERVRAASVAQSETESVGLRGRVAVAELDLDETRRRLAAAQNGLRELHDLTRSLRAQSDRLTRAIVAEEWLVDFDFLVCPRCGTEVPPGRADRDHCYLCLQTPEAEVLQEELVLEQERVASQIVETERLIEYRTADVADAAEAEQAVQVELARLHNELDRRTAEFISARSEAIEVAAARRARAESQLAEQQRYRALWARLSNTRQLSRELEERLAELQDELAHRSARDSAAEANILALEERFQDYVTRLGLVLSDRPAVATINRTTFLPQIDGRPFDGLSSQGLSVLVNVAHALAHHTVAIDRGLSLPGLLVLDGVSNNVGHEGFDLDRRDAAYQLMIEECELYSDSLQLIVLDNDVPEFAEGYVVLTLTPSDRLVATNSDGERVPPTDHSPRLFLDGD